MYPHKGLGICADVLEQRLPLLAIFLIAKRVMKTVWILVDYTIAIEILNGVSAIAQ